MTSEQTFNFLRLLFWLKGRLVWRAYTKDISALLGVVLIIVAFAPLAFGGAIGALIGFFLLSPAESEQLLRGLLLGVYLFWLFSLIFGFALNEDYDISKLFLYPISPRLLFLGTILTALLDIFVLLLLPTLLAVLIGFSRHLLAFPFVALGVGLFFFHTMMLIQALRLAGAGILRSRRFRDVMVVLLPLFALGIYAIFQLPSMLWRQAENLNWSHLLHSRTWELINYLPPGLAARGIAGAAQGHYLAALGYLGILALLTAGTVYLAGWLIHSAYAGEGVGGSVGRRANGPEPATVASPANTIAWVNALGCLLPSAEMQALADKEIKYLMRDPYFKANLMGSVYILVMGIFFIFGFRGREMPEINFGPALFWGWSSLLLLGESALTFNIFGSEGFAAATLFLFPVSRRKILLSKNLVRFVSLLIVNGLLLLFICAVAKQLTLFFLIGLWLTLATLLMVGVGNLISIWFPYRIVMKGWRPMPQSASRNFTLGFVYMGIFAVVAILALPILAGIVVPAYWVSHFWFVLTLPLVVAYALGAYFLCLTLGEKLLASREIAIVEQLAKED